MNQSFARCQSRPWPALRAVTLALALAAALAGCSFKDRQNVLDPETRAGLRDRASLPPMPPKTRAALQESFVPNSRGVHIPFYYTDATGYTRDNAIVLVARNMREAYVASVHLLKTRFPNNEIRWARESLHDGHFYHEWRVKPERGMAFTVYIDSTWFQGFY